VPWYQLFYLMAIVGGAAVIVVEGRRRQFDVERWAMCTTAWVIGGIVGATLPHLVLGELATTRTAVGAVAGATLAIAVAASLLRIRPGQALDATAIAIPIGGALARLGCFVADCCQGIATKLPIGIADAQGVVRHPTQLYESAVDVAIATWLVRRAPGRFRDGHRFLVSLGAMSSGRFAIEFLRDSDRLGPLSLAQWVVGPAALLCFAAVALDARLPRVKAEAPARVAGIIAALAILMLSATGTLGALETSSMLLAVVAGAGFVSVRKGRIAPAGMAALMLQMPAPADSTFPQRFAFWGVGFGAGSYRAFHQDDHSCDSGPFNEWNRFHKYMGGSAEAGYLRQGSQWSGRGMRGRVSYSRDHADHAIATYGVAPNPSSYSVTNFSAGVFGDMTGHYAALTLGVTGGRMRPAVDGFLEGEGDPMRPWAAYPAIGVRLGAIYGPSLELRFGDEAPLNIPMPLMTFAIGLGDKKGNRVRGGFSDMGIFAGGTFKAHNGLEIMPSLVILNDSRVSPRGGAMAIRQWRRLPPVTSPAR
jgi:phosphatidylglycerol---prolipoprotein diacylglyceryl transferase